MSAYDPGPRTKGATLALRLLFLAVAGLFLFRFGLPGMVLGGHYVAEAPSVTAHLDSEVRFLSAIGFGVGLGALWLFRSFERMPRAAVLLALSALLGGLMRIVSIVQFGVPGTTAVMATAIEIIVPITVIVLLRSRARDTA